MLQTLNYSGLDNTELKCMNIHQIYTNNQRNDDKTLFSLTKKENLTAECITDLCGHNCCDTKRKLTISFTNPLT